MKKFRSFLGKLLLFMLPFVAIISIFIIKDPYKVIKKYKAYNSNPLILNQGYICWENYLNNRDSLKYDAFILGNSCCMAYKVNDWKQHIDNSNAIVVMGSSESIYSIHAKIKRLKESHIAISHALILMDHSVLKCATEPIKHTFILHPDITGSNKLQFQGVFLQAFCDPSILIPYLDYSIFGKRKKYMKGIIGSKQVIRHSYTNDLFNPRDKAISRDSIHYWDIHKKDFPKIKAMEENPVIGNKQIELLTDIKNMLVSEETEYKIIINPNYEQYQLNRKDLIILNNIFSSNNVYDFSGTNKYTKDIKYFYEGAHYRPLLGKTIMREIYK